MDQISISELIYKLEREKINIIDIRNNYEYQLGKIPTAKNINKIILLQSPSTYLDKTNIYYIYCQSGNSSNNLVKKLNSLGYNTVNIIGGYNNYLLRK